MIPATVRPVSASSVGAGCMTAASRWTSPSATAQTSQRSWVTIRSGASRRSDLGVHADDRLARRVQPPDLGVDGRSGARRVDRSGGDPGKAQNVGRIVALVGDAHQAAGLSECRHDLGGRR